MSAIAAVVGADASAGRVLDLLARMPERGPDGRHTVVCGDAAIGHALFQTTPEDQPGCQPARSRDGTIIAVLDGWLGRRDELAATARANGAAEGRGDAALLAEAYAVAGERVLERLTGDYAALLWDTRRGLLIAARDPFGMRPLHWSRDRGGVTIASELRALVPDRPRAIDEGALAEWLAGLPTSRTATLLRDVARLEPGCVLRVHDGICDVRRVGTLAGEPEDPRPEAALHEVFRTFLACAVRERLRAKGRAGVLLSAGLDSTTVFLEARRADPDVAAWTVDQRAGTSETAGAAATVRHLGGLHHVVAASARSFDYRGFVGATFEPPPHPAAANTAALRRAAAGQGCRVLLNGLGGDECFGTNRWRCADLLARGRLLSLWCAWRQFRGAPDPAPLAPLVQATLVPVIPRAVRGLAARLAGQVHTPPWIAPRWARAVALDDRLRDRGATPGHTHAGRARLLDLTGGASIAANEEADRVAAFTGTEDRSPYFDRSLVEFSLRLAAPLVDLAPTPKQFVRAAYAEWLPAGQRRYAPAHAFEYLLAEGLEAVGGRGLFDRLVLDEHGCLDRAYLRRAVDATWPSGPARIVEHSSYLGALWHVAAAELAVRALTGHPETGV